MIRKLTYIRSKQYNPYLNLALEEYLLENVNEDECILYLWQNEKTVVFGRNQNPWKECKINELKNDGGHLVRRLSGGGAVFHDLGNLNFTFLVRKVHYDVNKQLEVIIRALKNLDISAKKSGRNDITVDGKKFSGNAFYKSGEYCYHHGTILIDVNKMELSKYLNVSADKLKSKGVKSVKSRITNLKEYRQDLSIDMMCEELSKAFSQVYNLRFTEISPTDIEEKNLQKRREFFESWDWVYGKTIPFTYETYERFHWGSFNMQINTNKSIITDCKIYSDAMDIDVISKIPEVLIGVIFSSKDIVKAIHEQMEDGLWTNLSQLQTEMLEDICQFITEDTTEGLNETEEINNISSGTAQEYISFDKNMKYYFEGEGNEYANFDVYVDYITDNKIQFRVDNGGSQLVEVIEKNDNNLTKNLSRGEVYYRENLTSKEDNNKDVILMDPISKGISWTTSQNETRTITDVDVSISTPIGTFDTVEVTTEGDYGKTKEYYAKEIGLIKRIYKQEDEEIISTLSKIEKNMPYVQAVRFFYPGDDAEGIMYKDKEISFNTNDITKMILEKEYKDIENDKANRVLPANAKILSLYLHDDNSVYIDFSNELISEMSAGSGYESLTLQSIVNTFGNYYGVEDVYLTVENNPYESGHILLKKGQKLKVDIDDIID